MTSPPERPWAGTGWDTLTVVKPPWWRRLLTGPAIALFVLALLLPFVATGWWLLQANKGREALHQAIHNAIVDGLQSGQCVDEIGKGETASLMPVSCSGPHDGEVTGVVTLSPGTYPGEERVLEESEQKCDDATDRWIAGGPGEDIDLDVGFFYPLEEGWSQTNSTTICYAVARSGDKIRVPLEPGIVTGAPAPRARPPWPTEGI